MEDLVEFRHLLLEEPAGLVVAATASVGHPDHDTLMDNLRHLREAHDARGQVLEVVELPLPRRVFGPYEELALSYVNFYLPNGAVVVQILLCVHWVKNANRANDLLPAFAAHRRSLQPSHLRVKRATNPIHEKVH